MKKTTPQGRKHTGSKCYYNTKTHTPKTREPAVAWLLTERSPRFLHRASPSENERTLLSARDDDDDDHA